ncbi:MAG: hypothetical protein JXA09_06280 [Anaerolineae bacterium]|nr:hypothetical protein [Anaerolineae bacterium]
MDQPDPTQATQLYQQRRATAMLRQQLYTLPDPSADEALAQALFEAEAALAALEGAAPREGGGVLLDTGEQGVKPGGILMGKETVEVEAQVLLHQPYIPTGFVHLLDAGETPLVTFHVRNKGRQPVRLRLISYVEGYSAKAIDTVVLQRGEPARDFPQLPTFFPRQIRQIREMTRATLHVRIDDLDGATQQHSTFPIWLLARSSAYLRGTDPATGVEIDYTPYLAAWVTPDAPEVMALLRRAADHHPARRIAGYQGGPEEVRAQVAAVYAALQAEQIAYINSTFSLGPSQGELVQRIRLPRESLAVKSANCIDGTVLMASLLEAASLHPGIAIVPGHAFLAWETGRGSGAWDYVETVMISTHPFEQAHRAGAHLAEKYRLLARRSDNARYFRLLSVPDLRAARRIVPME